MTIFAKLSILDAWKSLEYASVARYKLPQPPSSSKKTVSVAIFGLCSYKQISQLNVPIMYGSSEHRSNLNFTIIVHITI